MKHKLLLAMLGAGAMSVAGCATHATPGAGAPSPSENASADAHWTANIQSVTQSSGSVVQTTRDRSYGSATWMRGGGPTISNINLVFTYAGQERYLSWAIVAGSCGSPALALLPLSNFPELQIGSGSRAQVTTSLPLELPTSGAYHIDIFRSRQQSTDALVACGNLKLVS
jgi:hypothetical protein